MGSAMGSRMSPQYANLFMARLEENFLSTCEIKPWAYFRFIDDILLIWTASQEELIRFHKNFSEYHKNIKLTLSFSTSHVSFLDTTIYIQDRILQTSIYRKPTDRHIYLKWKSFHPEHTKKSIVYSQALRYNRICSNSEDRDRQLMSLRKIFIDQGYHPQIVDDQIHRATLKSREELLKYTPKTENNRIPIVVTYNPKLKTLRKILKALQPILHKDKRLKDVFPDLPLLAFRQPPNLRQMIIRSALSTPETPGTLPCNNTRCETCPYILSTSQIQIPNSQKYHQIQDQFSCETSNVVYMIRCMKCPSRGIYIGETGQKLRTRMNHHRFKINEGKMDTPVGQHFCEPGHSMQDLKVLVLKGNFKNDQSRKLSEYKFMKMFKTLTEGLNCGTGFMTPYVT
ncbi:uncharacterized protein [Hyperolius riggenbachi]|uniref:uncharacterized protein n=1 Tax=Hyperolius riggenbachi TaxID=752182 RepID=UPI0035A2CDA8